MIKVLVLGGTGAIGEHLVNMFFGLKNFDVYVTSRKQKTVNFGVNYIQGDAHNIVFLTSVLHNNFDVIVDFMSYSTEEFRERYNLFLDHSSQYVYISSSRVYAENRDLLVESSFRLLDVCDDSEYLSSDEYALAKARQENFLRNSKKVNWTVIRPYITFSETRLQLGELEKEDWLYRSLHGRTIVLSKSILDKITTLTYGLDVARGIFCIIQNEDAFGNIYHIATTEFHYWHEILDFYLEVLDNKTGKKNSVLLMDKSLYLNHSYRKYQVLYDRCYNRRFDNRKIGSYVDVNGFERTEVGLKDCLEKFLKNPKFNEINWKHEALRDWLTGERAEMREMDTLKKKAVYIIYRYVIFEFKRAIDKIMKLWKMKLWKMS